MIDLRRENEVVAGQALGVVRPAREGGPSPLELDARVVTFGLGEQRDPRDEAERLAEIVKSELAGDAAAAVSNPGWDLAGEPGELGLRER